LEIFHLTAEGKINAVPAIKEIDSVRWFDKIHYYLWRISFHFPKKIKPRFRKSKFGHGQETFLR
jgi:hypothetical protein